MATFVVTGTGRCGTAHFVNVLRALGIPASHETYFGASLRTFTEREQQAYRSFATNDVSLFAAPFLARTGVPSIHLVRNPIDCVNSFLHLHLPLGASHELCEFIRHWITPEGETDEEQWVDYWEKWNHLCAQSATVTVRVESLSSGEADGEVADIVGSQRFVDKWRELPQTKNRVHSVDSSRIPPHLLPRLRRAGEAFGY